MRAALAPVTQPRTFLAFDFGTRRVGVASGNSLTGSATPIGTVEAVGEARFAAIAKLVAEWQPEALVVGVPFHPDGVVHVNTRRARGFARALGERFGVPVHEVDERYTTTEAARTTLTPALSRKRERGNCDIDARAAAIILEQYLAGADA